MDLKFDFKLVLQILILFSFMTGVLIFFLKKILFDSTQGAVNRLNRETEAVRAKQAELNEKIKQANQELARRRAEADALVAKMATDAEEKAKLEREKIIVKARQEADEIINKAQKTKDEMRKTLEKDIDLRAVNFSIFVLSDVFSQRALSAFNECLIQEFFESLQKVDMDMLDSKLTSAEVVTALPPEDSFKTKLQDILKKKLNRSLDLNYIQDKKIISGTILRFGSLSLDGSLVHLLQEKGVEVKDRVEKGMLKI